MSLSAFILRLDPLHLRVLCAVGFISGLTTFLISFRRARTTPEPQASVEPKLQHAIDPTAIGASSEAMPQVVRLSLPSISARSTEMSQQEKVAAALMRAGLANAVSWTDTSQQVEDSVPGAKQESNSTISNPAIVPPTHYIKSPPLNRNTTSRALGRKLLLVAGAILALASLFLFLRIR